MGKELRIRTLLPAFVVSLFLMGAVRVGMGPADRASTDSPTEQVNASAGRATGASPMANLTGGSGKTMVGVAPLAPSRAALPGPPQPVGGLRGAASLYDNGAYDPAEPAPASQHAADVPFWAAGADDFVLPGVNGTAQITGVNFTGVFGTYGDLSLPDGGLEAFLITFYDDDPGNPGQPLGNPEDAIGVLYQQSTVVWTSQQLSVCDPLSFCEFAYQATLPVPFQAQTGQTYWVSVQAVMPFAVPEEWGQMFIGATAADTGLPGVRGFPVLGDPWWVPIEVGNDIDLSFELIGSCCTCDDGDPCTTDTWNPATQACVFTPLDCDDGDPCTQDSCVAGVCQHNTCPECPVIQRQPGCANVATGADATFTVSVNQATVVGPLQIEWFKDDVFAGSGPELTLSNVQPADHGARLRCKVTDLCGVTDSDIVALTVDVDLTAADDDGDCDADLRDYSGIQRCIGSVPPSAACLIVFDLDSDLDVDTDDYALFSQELDGPKSGCVYSDTWATDLTPGNATVFNFSSSPIPADFFAPGSAPFTDAVTFIGQATDPQNFAGTDTRVGHRPLRFPPFPGNPLARQVATEMVSLQLAGTGPITVTVGGVGEAWLVAATLSTSPATPGTLIATLECPNGGHFDATVLVQPRFAFAKLQDVQDLIAGLIGPDQVAMRTLDTGENGLPPITMDFVGQPFSLVPDPGLDIFTAECAGGDFVPGIDGCGARGGTTCVSHITPGESHYFCPPECQPPDKCVYTLVGVQWCCGTSPPGDPCPCDACSNPDKCPGQVPSQITGDLCAAVGTCEQEMIVTRRCFGPFGGGRCPTRWTAVYELDAQCGAFQCP